jgi:DNA-binding NtrC family response regulator
MEIVIEQRDGPRMPALVGESLTFKQLRSSLETVARAQRTTLVLGPTGSGKDVVARTLHECSPRRSQPFVAVQCAALPENLVEAELFGHSRGAFTGAMHARPGLIRSAAQGTLFLDEVDSLTLGAQAKLLRFLETGEYRSVGSDRVEHSSSWVIAATNRELRLHVKQGRFREDLLYRLEVVQVRVPALRDRSDDILELAEHFLRALGCTEMKFSDLARRTMRDYEWPGNVRELKHRVESAALLAEGTVIDVDQLGLTTHIVVADASPEGASPTSPMELPQLQRSLWGLVEDNRLSLTEAVELCEGLLIQAALRAESGNRTRAAARLGIHVRTLYKKLN